MICKHCGREIPDKSEYCEYCNESTFEKIVLGDSALEKAKKQQKMESAPFFIRAYYGIKDASQRKSEERLERKLNPAAAKKKTGTPFYRKKEAFILGAVLSVLPVLCAVLSIFTNWVYMWVKMAEKIKTNMSMLDIVKKGLKVDQSIGQKRTMASYVPMICMILLVITAIYILYLAVIDLYPKKSFPEITIIKRHSFIARAVPVVLLILIIVIFTHCKVYKGVKTSVDSLMTSYSGFVGFDDSSMSGFGHGFGFVLAILTPIFYLISKIYIFIYNTLNEDD